MSRIIGAPLRAAIFSLGLVMFFGCSSLPTAPAVDKGSTASAPGASLLSLGGGDVPQAASSPTSASTTRTINGLFGGTVKAGNFTVIIPPAAFLGTANVTVTQPDLSQLVCNLSIDPASKNHFLLPVLFLADCKGKIPPELLSISQIQWFNPATGDWETVPGCSINLLDLTIQVPLWHFSTYRVEEGKAGW